MYIKDCFPQRYCTSGLYFNKLRNEILTREGRFLFLPPVFKCYFSTKNNISFLDSKYITKTFYEIMDVVPSF